jgi:hypothetical protein
MNIVRSRSRVEPPVASSANRKFESPSTGAFDTSDSRSSPDPVSVAFCPRSYRPAPAAPSTTAMPPSAIPVGPSVSPNAAIPSFAVPIGSLMAC